MRRAERAMNDEDTIRLLEEGQLGVLSTASPDGIPYGVPLNYCFVREETAIYFHCANEGKKIDNLKSNARVSFAVVASHRIIPEKLTTYYESVMVSGRVSFITDDGEKALRFDQLCRHLTPGIEWRSGKGCLNVAAIVRIDIESISGKKNGEA